MKTKYTLTIYFKTQQYHSLLSVQKRSTLVFTQNLHRNTCMGLIHTWHELIDKQHIPKESNNHWYIHMIKKNCSLIKEMKSPAMKTHDRKHRSVLLPKRGQSDKAINYDSKYIKAFKYFPSQAARGQFMKIMFMWN